jgi:hypothetical protein
MYTQRSSGLNQSNLNQRFQLTDFPCRPGLHGATVCMAALKEQKSFPYCHQCSSTWGDRTSLYRLTDYKDVDFFD